MPGKDHKVSLYAFQFIVIARLFILRFFWNLEQTHRSWKRVLPWLNDTIDHGNIRFVNKYAYDLIGNNDNPYGTSTYHEYFSFIMTFLNEF